MSLVLSSQTNLSATLAGFPWLLNGCFDVVHSLWLANKWVMLILGPFGKDFISFQLGDWVRIDKNPSTGKRINAVIHLV